MKFETSRTSVLAAITATSLIGGSIVAGVAYADSVSDGEFSCSPSGYLLTPGSVTEVSLAGGGTGATYAVPTGVDAIGYRDGYLYGWDGTGRQIVKVASNGSTTNLGLPAGMPADLAIVGGDVIGNTLWLFANTSAGVQYFAVDLSASPAALTTSGTADLASGLVRLAGDWAHVPGDDTHLYAVGIADGTNARFLVAFNTGSGAVTQVADLGSAATGGTFDSIFADGSGSLWISESTTGKVLRVDPASGSVTLVSTDGPTGGIDGAYCSDATVAIDFGDAPDSYGTRSTTDAARATLVYQGGDVALALGSSATAEYVAKGVDGDEDDALASVEINPGDSLTFPVKNDTEQVAYVYGWLDANANGAFDADELVGSAEVAPGQDSVTLPMPTLADGTKAWLRLIIAMDNGTTVAPTGGVYRGEIEDYEISYVDAPASITTTVKPGTITDTNGDGKLNPGEKTTFVFTVTNNGNEPLTDVSVTVPGLGTVTCQKTTLAVGESTTCETTPITATEDDLADGLDITGTATGKDQDGADVTSQPATTMVPVYSDTKASITTTVKPGTITDTNGDGKLNPGEKTTFVFTVTNNGNEPLTDVSVTVPGLGTVTCQKTTLAVGESTTCETTPITATEDDLADGLDITGTATGKDQDGADVTSQPATTMVPVYSDTKASITTTVKPGTITDTNGDGKLNPGEKTTFVFTVTNNGNEPLTDVSVTVPGLGTVTCQKTTLAVGESTTCETTPITATEDDLADGLDITGTATGKDQDGADVTSQPATTMVPVYSDTKASITTTVKPGTITDTNGDGKLNPGEKTTFVFTVTNNGNEPLTDVSVTVPGLGTVTCQKTTLAVGESTTCETTPITATEDDLADGLDITGTATGKDQDGADVTSQPATTMVPVYSDTKASITTTVKPGTITDTNGDGKLNPGEKTTFVFTVTNNGNEPLTDVSVTVPGLGTVTCQKTTLAVGESTTCETTPITATEDDLADGLDITGTATGKDQDGADVTSQPATTMVPVYSDTKASITTTVKPGTITDTNGDGKLNPGEKTTFVFTVTNNGNEPLTDVSVTVPGLGTVTCQKTTLAVGESTTCETTPITATEDDLADGLDITGTATGKDQDGADVTSQPATTMVPVYSDTKASITTTVKPGTITDTNGDGKLNPGEKTTFVFTVTNNGNEPLTDVSVTVPGLGTVTCQKTTLAVGESTTCETTPITATEDDLADGLDITGTATGKDQDGADVTSQPATTMVPVYSDTKASITTTVKPGTITDTNGDGKLNPGEKTTFVFTVTNNGNEPLTDVSVTVPGLGTVTCQKTTLAVGESTTCETTPITATAEDLKNGQITITGTAKGTRPNGDYIVSGPASTAVPVVKSSTGGGDGNGDGDGNGNGNGSLSETGDPLTALMLITALFMAIGGGLIVTGRRSLTTH